MGNSIKRLLSFAIAMVMVLGMVPFNSLSVFAAEEAVAITTEAALQAALESSGNVTLGSDVNVATSLNIAEGVEITLDLAGHKIIGGFNGSSTTNHIYVLKNYGNLTVKDSVGDGAIVSRGVYNYGELTLESGTIDSCDGNGGYAVYNQSGSTFVMNGGTVIASYEDDYQSSSGGYDATAMSVPSGCVATLNGGTITDVCDFTFAIDAKGTLNIPADSTVTVQGNHGAISINSGTTTINGGTFKTIADEYVRTDNVLYVNGGQLVINGGNFIGDSDIPAGGSCVCFEKGTATINGGNFSGSSGGDVWGSAGTVINGGNFENLIETSYVAVGATIVNKGKTYTMTENGLEEVTSVQIERPTATVTQIKNEDLTFTLNFVADEATDEQLSYYGAWYADYVLTVNKDITFNADGSADGWLSGQYDAWSENWVNVPFENVTLAAGQSLKIMEYAAELMNKKGLKYTYAEVYEAVKDFDCGVYLDPEFLAANPDLEITLELRMYNNNDETESYAIGETYVYTIPGLPTATVTKIKNKDLTFALNFKADDATDEQLYFYGDWYADYVLTVNKDITFNADGSADGWLSGQYDEWSENWVNVPFSNVTLAAGESLKIMEYAAELMGKPGLKYTYGEVYEFVKDFDCGVYLDPEFIKANPDLEITLELRAFNNKDESVSYVIGETYVYTIPGLPTATVTKIKNEDLTFALNFKADDATEEQLYFYGDWYADYVLTVNKDITFNADGSADGWLSGQYDEWSENWVNVPFSNVTLAAGESLKIMEYAAELMNKKGLKYTYGEVYEFVKDFDCGVYLDPEFIKANRDLEITLELRMYNNEDETESYVIGETYVFTIPGLPTATVTQIENEDLTFALNFVADEATDEQLAFYGDWYADYVLTVNKDITFNADGSADGWLSGQYDEWSENWVNVPFSNVTLAAGESLKIMEYAAELMNKKGLKYTYGEVYEFVKDFDCGVYLDPEFIKANRDLEITLELRMYNNEDETENYVIGETYVFTIPGLPTATVTEIENEDLTFALNFVADEATDEQLYFYGDWYADYVLTVNKDITLNADGSADGWLSGQYDEWSENWVNVPFSNVTLAAGESLKIMEYAAELMGKPGLKYTYGEVYEFVKDFDCGMFLDDEFIAANPDVEITLELRMYNNEDETESYVIGQTYVFTLEQDVVAKNLQTNKTYSKVTTALSEAVEGETVQLLRSVADEQVIVILNGITLDLNGYTLSAAHVIAASSGGHIEDSTNGTGLLEIQKSNLTLLSNEQLPVWIEGEGYRFASAGFGQWTLATSSDRASAMFGFYLSGDYADYLVAKELADGAEDGDGLKIQVVMEYTNSEGSRSSLTFNPPANVVANYAKNWAVDALAMYISGLNTISEISFRAVIVSGHVTISGAAVDYVVS